MSAIIEPVFHLISGRCPSDPAAGHIVRVPGEPPAGRPQVSFFCPLCERIHRAVDEYASSYSHGDAYTVVGSLPGRPEPPPRPRPASSPDDPPPAPAQEPESLRVAVPERHRGVSRAAVLAAIGAEPRSADEVAAELGYRGPKASSALLRRLRRNPQAFAAVVVEPGSPAHKRPATLRRR